MTRRVTAGTPPVLNLALTAQPQTVRILTDLDQGQVAFDDQPPVDLQEGQFILDKVAPGSHTVTVTAKSGDATFTFDIAEAKPPVLTGTIAARNLIAVVVSSFGNQARVVTNSSLLEGRSALRCPSENHGGRVPGWRKLRATMSSIGPLSVAAVFTGSHHEKGRNRKNQAPVR